MSNLNLPSTFISPSSPSTNYSFYPTMYVGNIPGTGTYTSLLQTQNLPSGNPWTSVVLQLFVYTKTGATPSAVNIQKVISPSPLDVSAAMFRTPVIIDPVVQTTGSVEITEIGSFIQIDLTSLINSWYTTSFPGIALSCTDGSVVLFTSTATADPATHPQLILSGSTPSAPTDVPVIGNAVETSAAQSITVPINSTGYSASQNISQKARSGFFCKNSGPANVSVGIQYSIDGISFTTNAPSTTIANGSMSVLTPGSYGKFARLICTNSDAAHAASLSVQFIGQYLSQS